MPLRDVLVDRPRILFVGINPSLTSEAAGHHFAGPHNPFWRLLYAAKLTPRLFSHEEDRELARQGLAITNLCPRATRAASELERAELERGRRALRAKIGRIRPRWVALVGITLYAPVCGRDRLGPPGPGMKRDRIGDARVFVLPNPSGLNASFPTFDAKLAWFEELRAVVSA